VFAQEVFRIEIIQDGDILKNKRELIIIVSSFYRDEKSP
jgi:hypothetical protein